MNNANVSSLTEKVVIYKKQRQVSEHGYISYDYLPYRTTWANVVAYNAQYVDGKLEDTNSITHKVILRYRNIDLNAKDRILYRGKMLELLTQPLAVEGKKQYCFVNAKELVEDNE